MTINAERSLYAVGSQSHVTFMDSRTMKNPNCVAAVQRGCGKRRCFLFLGSRKLESSLMALGVKHGVKHMCRRGCRERPKPSRVLSSNLFLVGHL